MFKSEIEIGMLYVPLVTESKFQNEFLAYILSTTMFKEAYSKSMRHCNMSSISEERITGHYFASHSNGIIEVFFKGGMKLLIHYSIHTSQWDNKVKFSFESFTFSMQKRIPKRIWE